LRSVTALFVVLFSLALLASSPQARAQDKEKLEAWQEKLLEALEKSGDQGQKSPSTGQGYAPSAADDPGARQAAAKARAQYGGQVLAVVRVGSGYRVRLLLDNGRVMTAVVRD
jgi:hypothetical protein